MYSIATITSLIIAILIILFLFNSPKTVVEERRLLRIEKLFLKWLLKN